MVASRGWKEERRAIIQWGGMLELQFYKLKHTLEMNAGDSCTEIGMHLMSLRCTLKLLTQ